MGQVSHGGLGMTSCFTVQGENQRWGWRWGAAGRRPRARPGGGPAEPALGTAMGRTLSGARVPPSCAPRPAFCRRIRRVCQLSSRPFAQGETRLGSGASQRLLSSRLVSRLTPASHLTPFLYANPASFASRGPGRGALTPLLTPRGPRAALTGSAVSTLQSGREGRTGWALKWLS